ncbi:MAG: HNH endonuclease [Pyrinomonadaceae bacterium]
MADHMIAEKLCSSCKATKTATEFYSHKTTKDGLQPCCKACNKTYYRAKKPFIDTEPPSLPGEQWKPVVGWEEYYEVSNYGRVRTSKGYDFHRVRGVLRPRLNNVGYYRLTLARKRQKAERTVHRLVAEAFLGPCPKGYEVNHRDGDKANNRLENLEYTTHRGNMRHAARVGLLRLGEANHSAKLTTPQVREIRLMVAGGMTHHAVAQHFNIGQATVTDIVRRKIWKHVG